jgi:hypothetical protein
MGSSYSSKLIFNISLSSDTTPGWSYFEAGISIRGNRVLADNT